MSTVKRVPLSHMRQDPQFWPRRRLNENHVRNLAEVYRNEGLEAIPPIVIAPADREGRNLLLDGWHRVEAARRAGLLYAPATVQSVASDEEAYEFAVRASSRGTQPMTIGEKRDAVDRLLATDPRRPDRAIAEIAGVSHTFVAQRRLLLGKPRAGADREAKGAQPVRHAKRLLQAASGLGEACGWCVTEGQETSGESISALLAKGAVTEFGAAAKQWLQAVRDWCDDATHRVREGAPPE